MRHRTGLIVGLLLAIVFAAIPLAAAGDPVTDWAANNTPLLVVIAVVAGGAAFFIKGLGSRNRTILSIVAIAAVALLILGFVNLPAGGGGTGVPAIEWNTLLSTTFPAAADAASEMLDTQGFTACDGGTPDLNGVIPTWNTNAFIDEAKSLATYQSDQDKDVSRTTSTFNEITCLDIATSIALSQSRDVNGDGTADAISWGIKIMSIGPATFHDANLTTSGTVFYDPDAGWECGIYTEGAEWVSCFGSSKYASTLPSSGDWVYVGSHAGAGAASDTAVIAIMLDTTVGSPAGYTLPTVGTIAFSFTFAVGSPEDPHVYTANWVLQTRA